MFGFLRKPLSVEHLQILQMIAQQVVLSVEGSVRMSGPEKKAMALELTGQILRETKIVAPNSVVDTAIEAGVHMMKLLGKENQKPSMPGLKLDISGRPPTSGGR